MPEFIQPEIETVGLGEKIEFNHSLENSELKEKFIKMYEQDPDSAWLELITTIISTGSPEEILKHYGIDGQKWGVRNGPPYPLSRKKTREMKKEEKITSKGKQTKAEALSKRDKAKLLLQKSDDMSTEELRKALERIKLEEEIKNFSKDDKQYGKKNVDNVLKTSGNQILTTILAGVGTYASAKLIGYYFGDDIEAYLLKKKK